MNSEIKKIIILIWGTLFLLILPSCTSLENTDGTEINSDINISGKVMDIQHGKDGYIVTIKTGNDKLYYSLVSLPNLGKNNAFYTFKKGENVAVQGKFWQLDGKNRLTVRKIISTDNKKFTICGEVISIQNGIDGYTAKIKDKNSTPYYITISIPNLGSNHKKYRNLEIGEYICVIGELWTMNNQFNVTVRDIQ
jgi:hypothetical protein